MIIVKPPFAKAPFVNSRQKQVGSRKSFAPEDLGMELFKGGSWPSLFLLFSEGTR